jgi:hypothetical protein
MPVANAGTVTFMLKGTLAVIVPSQPRTDGREVLNRIVPTAVMSSLQPRTYFNQVLIDDAILLT